MGAEQKGVKTGGLFHLFDWNKKSRKKLFANRDVSPEGATQGTEGNDNVQASRLCIIEDDDTRGLLSLNGSSDYSCASSVTDEEGNGTRAPGVIARLMGLDSFPTVGVSEPYSTPLFDSRSLRENCYRKKGPESHIDDHFSNVGVRSESPARKPLGFRSQKMPSSPIERFQTEALPPRSAKSLPITRYKLLSPIKNPNFISGKNAAHILVAAAKILEPGPRVNANGKATSPGTSSLALEVREPEGRTAVSQRLSKLSESSGRSIVSNASKYLKGYSLNKSWNAQEDCTKVKVPREWGETSSTPVKGKGKTISLAIQAKFNVQRKEGSTTSTRSLSIHREQDEMKLSRSFKSQTSSKNKPQKIVSKPDPCGVLKQNNQKQNSLSNKDNISLKSSISNQQIKKIPSEDANSRKNKTLHTIRGHSKAGYRKEDLQVSYLGKDGTSSTTKGAPRKKRLIDKNHQSEKKSFTDTILVGSHERYVQSRVMIDEHQEWDGDGRTNGADIVSFTFTSPMIKSRVGAQLTHITERQDLSSFCEGAEGEKNGADSKTNRLSSMGLNIISGDALSVLLEQKLRELTSGLESSSSNLGTVGDGSASALYPSLLSASENSCPAAMERRKEPTEGPCETSFCDMSDNLFSVNDRLFNLCTKLQGAENMIERASCSSDAHKEPEQQYPSPLSILEASFSSESCSSSDSSDTNNGSKICSSVEAQKYACMNRKDPSGEAEMDLSDSASSICAETANEEHGSRTSTDPTEISKHEKEYVRDILQDAGIDFEDMAAGCSNHFLDPLLFDLLENKKNSSWNRADDKNHRLWRKVVFDCVGECLESKCSRYSKAGCRTWAKGTIMIGRVDGLVDEIFKEILGWKSMGDWLVDELVDRDMSSPLGRWVDFELEAFEAGIEIEEALVSCLIGEVVADFMM
uniref:Uncharacterized protein n=1 Tax=Anthurium amnicola TaxID=1678845 RepID=A0A1D1ZJ62_9ARAE